MIIKFSNLGSIKETELDLRPLTIIIGPNNTNKTYIAYSLYGLWQFFRRIGGSDQPSFRQQTKNRWELSVDTSLTESFIEQLEVKIHMFKERLRDYFQDSTGRLFSKTDFTVNIASEEIEEAVNYLVLHNALSSRLREMFPALLQETALTVSLENNVLSMAFDSEKVLRAGISNILPIASHFLFSALSRQLFSNPFLLPAERNAFVLTYKLLANKRYKILKDAQQGSLFFDADEKIDRQKRFERLREQGDMLYPQPIEDFLDFMIDLEFQRNARIESNSKNEFQLLADDMETHIQNTNRTILIPTKFGGKEIKINVKRGLSIDLYNASSSIKQLAPLLLYLRYRAAENDLLIIDEPEMNLHPESQAKLLEALGILVNLGVKVLLTTHSPYFMAHLNDLVNGDTENPATLKRQATSLYLKDQRAFLRMDQVSAYEMKKNKLSSLKDEDYGIRWDTLSDVSAEIQQKYFEISEKKSTTSHGKKK